MCIAAAIAADASRIVVAPSASVRPVIQAHRVTDGMRSIAARMDRKLEVDRRFNAKGSLGEYSPKQGVLRIRQEGCEIARNSDPLRGGFRDRS